MTEDVYTDLEREELKEASLNSLQVGYANVDTKNPIDLYSKITFYTTVIVLVSIHNLKASPPLNSHDHMKALISSFHLMNGYTLGFYPET